VNPIRPRFLRDLQLDRFELDADDEEDAGRLIHVGRRLHRSRAIDLYTWSDGALAAAVGPGEVLIQRLLGPIDDPEGPPLVLTTDELRRLLAALSVWSAARPRFARYEHRQHLYAARAFTQHYTPPGVEAPSVSAPMGVQILHGQDERIALATPETVAPGVALVGRVVRSGEPTLPSDEVGAVYSLGGLGEIIATHAEANLIQGGVEVLCFVYGDEAFVAALVDLVA
jgi:hypothetical protein